LGKSIQQEFDCGWDTRPAQQARATVALGLDFNQANGANC
jgi:hypothetical protein